MLPFSQGYFLAYQVPADAAITPRVAFGAAVQLFGLCSVVYADTTLIFLRKSGETGKLARWRVQRSPLFLSILITIALSIDFRV
jgi:hypothetical protein